MQRRIVYKVRKIKRREGPREREKAVKKARREARKMKGEIHARET